MQRIGIIQIKQESHSFNPVPTTRADFERFGYSLGEQVIERDGEVDELGGFLDGLRAFPHAVQPVGIMRAQAWSGGPVSTDCMRWLEEVLGEQLDRVLPVDGVLFSLHGAMAGAADDDLDGRWLDIVRRRVGPDVPIVASIDLHTYLTRCMIRHADLLVAYHTNPHMDMRQTGVRAATALQRLFDGAKPTPVIRRIPMTTSGEATATTSDALVPVFERVRELETDQRVLSAAVLMTQTWLDVPEMGWCVMIAADNDAPLAKQAADELAEMCWQSRTVQTSIEMFDAEQCVARALQQAGKPVVIADGSDAFNSGAPGDSTHLLAAMLGTRIDDGALTIMADPESVAYAQHVGEDGAFEMDVGGKRDRIFSRPIHVRGRVCFVRPTRYVTTDSHAAQNLPIDMGLGAAVRIDDVTILFVEYPGLGSTPMMYRCVGLEPTEYKIVVVKSPAGFRAEFGPIAADMILSDCPGCATSHLERLPFRHISRPVWPLDDVTDWRRVEWVRRANEQQALDD